MQCKTNNNSSAQSDLELFQNYHISSTVSEAWCMCMETMLEIKLPLRDHNKTAKAFCHYIFFILSTCHVTRQFFLSGEDNPRSQPSNAGTKALTLCNMIATSHWQFEGFHKDFSQILSKRQIYIIHMCTSFQLSCESQSCQDRNESLWHPFPLS